MGKNILVSSFFGQHRRYAPSGWRGATVASLSHLCQLTIHITFLAPIGIWGRTFDLKADYVQTWSNRIVSYGTILAAVTSQGGRLGQKENKQDFLMSLNSDHGGKSPFHLPGCKKD